MLQLVRLSKAFDGVPAVDDVSLDVPDNEYLTLLGPSGSGKSTLLRLIAGLERPDDGAVLLEGTDLTHRPTHARGLGFVQQNYALFPHLDLFENVAFGLRNRLVDPVSDEREVRRRVEAMLELVGLSGLGNRAVGAISGGQKQRVSLARTLVTEPRFCLLDEPLGALDANLRERMTLELKRIRDALGVTFVHVTGNEQEALAMGHRMAVMDRGRLLQVAAPEDIHERPATAAVARYLNTYNIFAGRSEPGGFRSGPDLLALPLVPGAPGSYAVRYDAVSVEAGNTAERAGQSSLTATFVTSEFLGSRFMHFFRRGDGGMVEVERHLGAGDVERFTPGASHRLSWPLDEVLLFDGEGRRIEPMDRAA